MGSDLNFLTGSTDKLNGEIKIGNIPVSSFISRIKKIQPDHTDKDTIGFLPTFRTESSTHTQRLPDTAISAHAKTAEEAEKTKIEMRDLNPTSFNKSGSLERSPPVRACLPLAQKNAFSIASPEPLSQFQSLSVFFFSRVLFAFRRRSACWRSTAGKCSSDAKSSRAS